ncbi:MAG TPA: glycosyltransferase family 9 protein [Mycobacteriales bacterium]|nr:glycosyltransferase family 9 protein [Mycobacteriales bacterium]
MTPDRGVREILVVELLGGLGDVLMVLPAVHALARTHPGAAVRVLTFRPGDQLLTADPHVAEVVGTARGTARAAVERELARRRYDLVVTTTRYDGIGELCATAAPRAVTDLWRRPPATERVDRRYLRLLRADGLIHPAYADLPVRVHLTAAERAGGRAALPAGDRPVLLVPDSGMRVKEWPADRWSALAARLAAAGHPVLSVPAPGRPGPVPGTRPLPPTDLRGLAAAFAAAAGRGGTVVGGDTGPLRLAAAVGARTVGLFGPTVATRYGLAQGGGAVDLQGRPDCPVRRPLAISEQECWWTAACPLSDGGPPACLADLTVAEVAAAVAVPAAVRAGRAGRW